jgi:hypothetical protein
MQANLSQNSIAGVNRSPGRVLYVGQSYYNTWYLSRALRKLGWKADVLNFDPVEHDQMFYHGEDFKFLYGTRKNVLTHVRFYWRALRHYDIFHFSGAWNLRFVSDFDNSSLLPERWDIKLLKKFGKKIVYSNNGCLDGVSQSSFRTWLPEPVCDICPWQHRPDVCSDERNLAWGKLRNSLADYQITLGGNRKDYNDDPRVHEVPEFYCLDPNVWNPDLLVPSNYQLSIPADTVKIYHSIGNLELRSESITNRNIKSTYIYLPTIERLKAAGHNVEFIFFHDVPNKSIRYYQAQADIVVDMLTYGWFGANVREAMMLGKPAICFLRPEWVESVRREIPEYVDELPVISATPENIYDVLVDLIKHPEKRREIGRRSREFAVKWHSAEAGGRKLDRIYRALLNGEQ